MPSRLTPCLLHPAPSESSLFIFSNRLILKTCGTTLNLLGLPRILSVAKTYAGLDCVYRCFYSRKSFMFPERQQGPHGSGWGGEVEFLDDIFGACRRPACPAPSFRSAPVGPLKRPAQGSPVGHHPPTELALTITTTPAPCS